MNKSLVQWAAEGPIIPNVILRREDLSINDKFLFGTILSQDILGMSIELKRVDVYAEQIHVSRRTVMRSLKKLREKDLIVIKRVAYGQIVSTTFDWSKLS